MRDADETIDRVMAGLRDVEPSPGMERRILEAVEAQRASPSPWFLRPSVAASLVCGAALAASLIVVTRVNQPSRTPANARRCPTNTAGGRRARRLPLSHDGLPRASRRGVRAICRVCVTRELAAFQLRLCL